MRPTAAGGGTEALDLLSHAATAGQAFPVVLLDAHMPGMDGFMVAEAIRTRPELARTTILMLSSADVPDALTRCQALQIADYLTKPVLPSELKAAIGQALHHAPDAKRRFRLQRQEFPPARRPLAVLLAEDNPTNQDVAVRMLQKWGHQVTVAAHGREAVEMFTAGADFDVILMGVQMPELNGLEATEAIRKIEHMRETHTPIIALTAHSLTADREQCLTAGMDSYLSKPIKARELFACLEGLPDLAVSNV